MGNFPEVLSQAILVGIILVGRLGVDGVSGGAWAYDCTLSESNFAICLPLEIPLRGFPLHMIFSEKYRIPNNSTNVCFQRISFENGNPLRGISSRKQIANTRSYGRTTPADRAASRLVPWGGGSLSLRESGRGLIYMMFNMI